MNAPETIGDYQIVDVLGRGGMGVVYRARRRNGADLAVKTVRIATESTLASIRREIQTLSELLHPGVVAIRDHGIADGAPWYAMDLLHGRTLRDDLRAWFPPAERSAPLVTGASERPTWVATEPGWPAPRPDRTPDPSAADAPAYSLLHVATLFRKICGPLAYVHGRGVIHRDLSPANVFLVGALKPVLFDFGLAAQFRTDSARDVLEISGLHHGTAHYMAPEQARGEVVDARADIYAVGCMLYEALTGRPPFVGDSPLAVVMQHLEVEPAPPSRHVPGLPTGFDDLVLRMLAKAPRDRIGYADDVATALERLGATPRLGGAAFQPRPYTYRPGLAGRTALIAAHDALLGELAAGTGGCAALIGESGVGKTRLAAEIAARAVGQDIRVITGECEPIGTTPDALHAAPLHPLRPLLRAIADRCRNGGAEETQRLLGRSGGLLAAYEPALAALGDRGDALTDHVSPDAARFLVLAALRDALTELARTGPLLLVLDDLQWADELTIAFLRSLRAELLETAGVFVLVTARAEELTVELDAMLRALAARRHEVPRLGPAAIGAMVRDMLALDDDAAGELALTELVAARSEGNPLFAAEYVRAAVDDGVLYRDAAGRWRHAHDDKRAAQLPTPESVQELVHRRLRSLSEPAREVALAAAVLGRSFRPDVLAAVAGHGEDAARTAIAEAIRRNVLEDQADGGLRFAHDKLREQAYAELAAADRPALHRRAAAAIERLDHDIAQHLPQLAHHWEVASDPLRASHYLERAADHALASAMYSEAHALLRRLVELSTTVSTTRRASWERKLGAACLALGDLAGCQDHVERALRRLGRSLPASRSGWAAAIARGVARQVWTHALGQRVRSAGSDPQVVEAALGSARMTSCYFFRGDSLALTGAALSAVNLAESTGTGLAIAEIYAQLGYIAGLARLRGVAHGYFARARATAQATRDPIGMVRAYFCEGAFHVGRAAWHPARTATAAGLALARELRNPQEAEDAYTILGYIDFATGDYAASQRQSQALLDSARARSNGQHEGWGLCTLARLALYRGDLDAAIRGFEAAIAQLAAVADHGTLVLCHGMLASALVRSGAHTRARVAADAATQLIGSRRPNNFTISEGYFGAADTYLVLARRGDHTARERAQVAIANLARLARVFPNAEPAAITAAGLYQLHHGSPRRAARTLQRALALAEQLRMPYSQALAHRGLAVIDGRGGSIERGAHAHQANTLFARLGCRWHLENPHA